jgi:YHYH protein
VTHIAGHGHRRLVETSTDGPGGEGRTKVTAADLDECNGHVGATPEYPNGIYHYHLKTDATPYTPNCYHGTVAASSTDQAAGGAGGQGGGQGGGPGGGQGPDLTTAAATLGVTVEQLTAALGRPPIDFAAAATKLGVSAAALEAAFPKPPGG